MLSKRHHIVSEIVDSERTYLQNLEVIDEVFYGPLCKSLSSDRAGIISHSAISSIFQYFRPLIQFHKTLLEQLEEACRAAGDNYDEACVGKIFIGIAEFFKMYIPYTQHYNAALAAFSTEKAKNSKFRGFLTSCAGNPRTRGLALPSFMIMPVQRLLKYHLLLKDLSKSTDESHYDAQDVLQAVAKVADVAAVVDSKQHEAENMGELSKLADRCFRGKEPMEGVVLPHRRLVALEYCRILQGHRKSFPGVVAVLNDVLVVGSLSPGDIDTSHIDVFLFESLSKIVASAGNLGAASLGGERPRSVVRIVRVSEKESEGMLLMSREE